MSLYAKIEEGIVTNIIVCEDSQIGTQYGHYVKVTENTNDAKFGDEYNFDKNKFKTSQPFESWVLNSDTLLWEAPVSKPEGEGYYSWDEESQDWIKIS